MTRVLVFVLLLLLTIVSIRWPSEHLLPWIVRLVGTFVVIAGGAVLARTSWWGAFCGRVQRRVGTAGRLWPAALAGVAAAISLALVRFVLEPFPHIEDEASYYFQARVFATGHLFARAPVFPEFFPSSWVISHEGRWFGIFPPGWPLLLAIGMKAGVPALVNPVLSGLCVLVIYELIREMYGASHAAWSALLCCASPFFVFMGGSFMSHTALLLLTSLSTLCHVKATRATRSAAWFWLAGLSAGCALLVRPADAVAIWGAQSLSALWVGRRQHLKGLALSAGGLMLGAVVYMVYNRALVGHWLEAPLTIVTPTNRMGFGSDIGLNWETFDTPGHNPWRALLNLNFNTAVMSQDLFGWPLSSLLFVIAFLTFGRMAWPHRLSTIIIGSVMAAYALYWYHGVVFGARFYFCLAPHLIVLTIEGIRHTPQIMTRYLHGLFAEPAVARTIAAAVVLSCIFGWIVYVPKVSWLGPYHDQRGINAGLYDFVAREQIESGIVFVQAPRVYLFSTGFIANELPLGSGHILYALDRGSGNRRLTELFPGRPVYRFTYQPERNPYRPSFAWLLP